MQSKYLIRCQNVLDGTNAPTMQYSKARYVLSESLSRGRWKLQLAVELLVAVPYFGKFDRFDLHSFR